jgi:hypothetical protein
MVPRVLGHITKAGLKQALRGNWSKQPNPLGEALTSPLTTLKQLPSNEETL